MMLHLINAIMGIFIVIVVIVVIVVVNHLMRLFLRMYFKTIIKFSSFDRQQDSNYQLNYPSNYYWY